MVWHKDLRFFLVVILITVALLFVVSCNGTSKAQMSSSNGGELINLSSAASDQVGESVEGSSSVQREPEKDSESWGNVYSKRQKSEESDYVRDKVSLFLAGKVSIREGDTNDFPNYRLWAVLELDEPIAFDLGNDDLVSLDEIQLGLVATEGGGQAHWKPYEGQRVVVKGTARAQTWNSWHLTPYYLDDATVLGSGAGKRTDDRDEVAIAFAKAVRTNYRIEDEAYVSTRWDYHSYVSPASELYEWKDGNDDGEEVLINGSPCRVEAAEVGEVVGDVYVMNVRICYPVAMDPVVEDERLGHMAISFNNDDLVEHLCID